MTTQYPRNFPSDTTARPFMLRCGACRCFCLSGVVGDAQWGAFPTAEQRVKAAMEIVSPGRLSVEAIGVAFAASLAEKRAAMLAIATYRAGLAR